MGEWSTMGSQQAVQPLPGAHTDRQTLVTAQPAEMKEGDQTTGLRRQMESAAKRHGREVKDQVLESYQTNPFVGRAINQHP